MNVHIPLTTRSFTNIICKGNLVEKTVYDNPQWDPLYHLYTYNAADMLTSESYGMSYFEYWKNNYSYDNRGNRTSLVKTIYGSDFEKGVTYTYDLNNRLISSATDNAYDDDFTTA